MILKRSIYAIFLVIFILKAETRLETREFQNEAELAEFLKGPYETAASNMCTKQSLAQWEFQTDVNNKTKEEAQLNATLEAAAFDKEYWEKYFKDLKPEDYTDETIKRQVEKLKILGNAALELEKLTELTNIRNKMTATYSAAKICPYGKPDCKPAEMLSLEPDIESIMTSSNDYKELEYAWTAWREVSGAKIKEDYKRYVELSNEAAKANGFKNKGEMWINAYESKNFKEDMDRLWQQVEPLYDELHKYVRYKLKKHYGNQINTWDGLIPAHVLGNMWGQSWINLYKLVIPFPDASEIDVTSALKAEGYDVLKMFVTADEFYKSLGLEPNDICYNVEKGAMIEKPEGRDVLCHASAWDFCDGENYRVKMCTEVNYEDFITIHHEMGHIQYYLLYKNQLKTLRSGANPGFHEAVGDTIALSVATPKHLKEIGLLKDYDDTEEASINALLSMALERVAFLPFGLLIDKWRWDVFAGEVPAEEWNKHWWDYRSKIQKLKPPSARSDGEDFDPGAKYHVAGDSQYINYFVAHILEFQLYRSLCKTAGQYDPEDPNKPLHKCDFYRSEEVGRKIREGLSLGASKHWKEALKAMTGEEDLDANAILDYFAPLYTYLQEENKRLSEEELNVFLQNEYEPSSSKMLNKLVSAEWNFATDVGNPQKEKEQLEAVLEAAKFDKNHWSETFQYLKEDDYEDEALKRQVKSLKVLGNAALDEDKLTKLTQAGSTMTSTYSTAKICPYENPECNLETEGLSLEPHIEGILATSTNYKELEYVWKAWRDATGAKMKETYKTYVTLSNEAAVANGFKDKGEMWRSEYESNTFIEDMDKLWEQVEPLYNELHKFILKKLKQRYGDELDENDGLIPAHLLGNMWAQSWINLASYVKPYPNASSVDVTAALKEQDYTPLKMFETSDTFYKSLGLHSNEMSYGKNAVIEKPQNREILCHASAWDFSDGEDFRIKMCTEVNYEDFITVHHEMGHIQYFIQYKDQPIAFRDGANPGFHEAVGDTIALSVATPKHLQEIGLLKDYEDSNEADINTLMDMALERVAFLPFGLLIDKWRWDVFSGDVDPENWNAQWWKYRKTIQKVKPPVDRSDENDFDPGAKFHVPGDSQYINYFVAHILEFQLYRSLCIAAKQYDPENPKVPLHKCDYYKSEEAGAKLRAGLSLGKSKHWTEVLEAMTGEKELDPTAILDYFRPLYEYLQEQNRKPTEEELDYFLRNEYENEASEMTNELVHAEWEFATDVANSEKEEAQLQAVLKAAEFDKKHWTDTFKDLNEDDYQSEAIKRQVKSLKVLGNAALNKDKLTELTKAGSTMTNIYSTAKICPFTKPECDLKTEGLSLEPDIEKILSTSTNYKELEYVWKAWRDATGANMKETYKTYVTLSNEAAVANGFEDKGDMWRSAYESDTFVDDMDKLWEQVEPLYNELHKFILRKLKQRYGDELDVNDGLIPAHLLGNMWAQSWINLASFVKPYPNASSIDVTAALEEQGYTPLKMFETSDEFYKSLGLESNEMSYGKNAVIEKPDREILCHASAWDFSDGNDFRIKMCTEVNYEDFITVHHEMGHIQYFIQYKDQPIAFRDGANPGFHEAVGDTIALSVATPKHLQKIGLLKDYVDSKEADINTLMDMALERLAFLPFGLLIDKWRWDVFANNDVTPDKWNSHWWNYRKTIQKVKPPVGRSDENDFDPGAKFHVPGDSQYINYFVAHILEFQLYRELCIAAKEYDPTKPELPLHKCDYYQSKEAGAKLKAGLSLGKSKHWTEVLETMTGKKDLDPTAILDYFRPLYEYLQEQNSIPTEEELDDFLKNEYENEASTMTNEVVHAQWNFATDVANTEKEEAQLEAILKAADFDKKHWEKTFKYLHEDNYTSEAIKRQVQSLKVLGDAALDKDKLIELTEAGSLMTSTYSTAKICPYQKQECNLEKEGLSLEPDIEEIMSTSKIYDQLEYVWKAWRDASGAKMKDTYKIYVNLSNEAAQANGFHDKGDLWRSDYESETFIDDMDRLWEKVKPLYIELHRFVTKRLKEVYGIKLNVEDGLIPAHVLGNMWAQSWANLASLVKPYNNASTVDVTGALKEQKYTVLKMFETSNEFYESLGLEPNKMSYGENAVIVKPDDKEILCHASAWDFSDKKDFRIKMCTEVNYEDFITIHHEMGHIQYFILYKDQPIAFRDGANPGFHEAVGDTIALSVATPKHLEKINLLKNYDDTHEAAINSLMDMALERVAFLPFGLLIDKWRWDVFSGSVAPEKWNSHWWHYRETIQKVKAPVNRSDAIDFDPGAKYHVPGDSQYINYFVAHILEFQLYKALCIEAKEYNPSNPTVPLHKCDFYQSKEAGKKLRDGLSLGKSVHWSEVLEKMTGQKDLDASAIVEYFEPLFKYMKVQNGPLNEKELRSLLTVDYEPSASKTENELVTAEWDSVTDLTNTDKQEAQVEATLRSAEFKKIYWSNFFNELTEEDYKDENIARQLKFLKNLGHSALDAEKLTQLTTVGNEMTSIYGTGKICPYSNKDCNLETEGLTLEPDIEEIMATSTDYKELEYAWTEWRKVSGAKIKDKYPKYVELSNEAAKANGFKDKGDMWRFKYESETFIEDIDKLWEQVKPLYDELHTYVSNKLKEKYGDEIDISDGLIPAHVLGNMWAQSWSNLSPLVKPYPDASEIDVTAELLEQGYTPLRMFETSDTFYKSLGLEPNDMSFNEDLGAIIVKPEDKEIVCHASAWDFSNGKDFRIKMCTSVNYDDFITVHHEMGHIQYFIQYKDQPIAFRDGANPGFHEAVGDTIALSVATPKHLQEVGLLKDYTDSAEADLNALMDMALERVAFLPFGLLIDKWRWDVFSGEVAVNKWNSHWWKYRQELQKIKSPVERSDDTDFDPGAKYHVPGDSQYINYFVARILQFQLYRGLCVAAGQYNPEKKDVPLHKCDFYKNKEAGKKLRAGLSLGSSKHWKVALEEITGETDIDASALLDYFAPLMEYLQEENHTKGSSDDEESDQTVPIVVGSILGVILVGGIGFYGYKRYQQR